MHCHATSKISLYDTLTEKKSKYRKYYKSQEEKKSPLNKSINKQIFFFDRSN